MPHSTISSSPVTPRGKALLQRHSVAISATVRDALTAINSLSGESMTLFALDPSGRLAGTVTDGDVRRALISGAALDSPVEQVMHRTFLAVNPGDDVCSVIAEGRRRKIDLLPVVCDGMVTDIIDLQTVRTAIPVDAVLMAGGKGERLRPLTEHTPKPLLPIGGKAIIDYNIENLEACGVEAIHVTVNYLADQIERHFEERDNRAQISCVREPRRLGTMGSLTLIDSLTHDDILLMNSDLLTSVDFEKLYLHHRDSGADVTMAVVPYTVSVPFAILDIKDKKVAALEEKPTYNYFANAGVYIFKRLLVNDLPKGEYLDAPDFITGVIAKGGHVGYFPIEGTWIDIGSPDDYRYANELMSRGVGF